MMSSGNGSTAIPGKEPVTPGLSSGAVAGIIVGCVLAAALVLGLIVGIWIWKMKHSKKTSEKEKEKKAEEVAKENAEKVAERAKSAVILFKAPQPKSDAEESTETTTNSVIRPGTKPGVVAFLVPKSPTAGKSVSSAQSTASRETTQESSATSASTTTKKAVPMVVLVANPVSKSESEATRTTTNATTTEEEESESTSGKNEKPKRGKVIKVGNKQVMVLPITAPQLAALTAPKKAATTPKVKKTGSESDKPSTSVQVISENEKKSLKSVSFPSSPTNE